VARALGGDASGFVSVSLEKDNKGEGAKDLFTVHTREATDDLIRALVRARNNAYPDAGTLSTEVVPRITLRVDGITLDHRPVVSWPGVSSSPVSEPVGQPEPDRLDSEQPRRQTALRRVIARELSRMNYEGV